MFERKIHLHFQRLGSSANPRKWCLYSSQYVYVFFWTLTKTVLRSSSARFWEESEDGFSFFCVIFATFVSLLG